MPMRMRSFLSKEIAGRIAQERAAPAFTARPVEPANDGDGDPVELSHDRLGRARELVGHRDDRRLQHVTGRVLLAEIALDRFEPGHTDRDVGQSLSPGPPERVGDDDAQVVPRQGPQPGAHLPRGAVRVLGQKAGGVGVDVRLVHARVGADPAVLGLDDQHALVLPHDAAALAEYDLDQPRISPEVLYHTRGLGRGSDVREPDRATLGLGHDFLADHEEVACLERCCLRGRGVSDEARKVVAATDLGQSFDADHLVARRHAQASGLRRPRRAGTSSEASNRALRVGGPRSRSKARSSGGSMSRPMPGSLRTSGRRPAARAATRWLSNEGSPNLSGITSGGSRSAALVPKPDSEGTNTTPGGSRDASASARSSPGVTHGTSPGMVRKRFAPWMRAACCAWATASVWPRLVSSRSVPAP